jgi:hypothetical protein
MKAAADAADLGEAGGAAGGAEAAAGAGDGDAALAPGAAAATRSVAAVALVEEIADMGLGNSVWSLQMKSVGSPPALSQALFQLLHSLWEGMSKHSCP